MRLQRASGQIVERLERRQLLALTINPTFAPNIVSDPNAATIEATINRTIAAYESLISDNVTVDITFQEGGGLGGSSGGLVYFENYADYRNALVSHATTANDNTAIASVPNTTNDPINNQSTITVRSPLARALGFSAPNAGGAAGDGTITLNTSICNLDRTGTQDSSKYDLQAVTAHEIDEILGFGSSLDAANNGTAVPTGRINVDDLFRYDQNGNRSYSSTATDEAYFSIDGGTTDLARFNQTHTTANAGDYGDWYSFFGGQTPQVQDAFNTPGATANLGVELTRLDVLGYNISLNAPVLTAAGNQTAVEGASKSFNLGSFTDPDAAPWGVKVNWGDGSPDTNYFLNSAGSLGTQSHVYAEEGSYVVSVSVNDFTSQSSQTQTYNVSVSDPAVIATGGFALTPVEGADSGAQTVATFTDPGGSEALSNYSATIDWGDGSTPSAGVISFSSGTFTVKGNHTYAEESAADHASSSPYDIKVTIKHETAPDAVVHSSATVSDPSVDPTGGFTIDAVEGTNTGDHTVATFTDPGGAESLDDYSASIDWGDGSTPSAGVITTDGSGTFTVTSNHTYITGTGQPDDFGNTLCGATPPSFTEHITVTLHHEDAINSIANSEAHIALPPASAHQAGGSLIVVGTVGNDQFIVTPAGNTGAVNVTLNNTSLGTFTLGVGGRVIVAALAGNDDVQIAGGVKLPTVLYGGPGDDRIKGGGGFNILCGCEGNDALTAGSKSDLLIGGDDADTLNGGQSDDILIAGNVLDPITLAEDESYSRLTGILSGDPISAADDNAVDVLQGAAGSDALYYHFSGTGVFDVVHGKDDLAVNI
jgi:Ca2+-binding RTX toxin-like protein